MKKLLTVIVLSISVLVSEASIRAQYDERVELISVVCHLAGFPEYNMNLGGDYIEQIDSFFCKDKNHPAIEMMRRLRSQNGIAYDAPMSFAVNLHKEGDGFSMINGSVIPERRWTGLDLKAVADTISDFYRKSDFAGFFTRQRPFYEKTCELFDSCVISKFNQDWYERFYGVPPAENFEVIIGFVNGGGNYGPNRNLPGRPRDVYAIIGYALDETGDPYYSSNATGFLNTLVHEFNHSFVNPLAEDIRFATQMEHAGMAMQNYSEDVMRRQAYTSWPTIVNESIVRAAVICYLMDSGMPKDEVRRHIVKEMKVGFYWTPELVRCLDGYSKKRQSYPTFDSYYPIIIDFFNNYADERSRAIDLIFVDSTE